jgi:uncharacterized membrane protein YuzA (DUF378 family)
MFGKSFVGMVAGILTVIGALNWGLVGLGSFLNVDLNVVTMILGGAAPQAVAIVYILVGLGGLVVLVEAFKK